MRIVLIVSQLELVEDDNIKELEFKVEHAKGEKCERCWQYNEHLEDGLCHRCKEVLEG